MAISSETASGLFITLNMPTVYLKKNKKDKQTTLNKRYKNLFINVSTGIAISELSSSDIQLIISS